MKHLLIASLCLFALHSSHAKSTESMNIDHLASDIAKLEGKKVQVSIGNIREVLKAIATLEAQNFIKLGERTESSPIMVLAAYSNTIVDQMQAKKKK